MCASVDEVLKETLEGEAIPEGLAAVIALSSWLATRPRRFAGRLSDVAASLGLPTSAVQEAQAAGFLRRAGAALVPRHRGLGTQALASLGAARRKKLAEALLDHLAAGPAGALTVSAATDGELLAAAGRWAEAAAGFSAQGLAELDLGRPARALTHATEQECTRQRALLECHDPRCDHRSN